MRGYRPIITIIILGVCVASGSAVAARGLPNGPARAVLMDCSSRSHRWTLTRRYDAAALRAAYLYLVRRGEQRLPCGDAIASQRALRGSQGSRRPASVIRDCLYHARLTRAYARRTLREAYRALSPAQKTETQCAVSVASQLNALLGARTAPVIRPRASRAEPANVSEPAQLAGLAQVSEVFARPRTELDVLSPVVQAVVNNIDQDAHRTVTDATMSRRIGPDGARMYAIPGHGAFCEGLEINDQTAVVGCTTSGRFDEFHAGIVVAQHGLHLWGFVPNGDRGFRVLTHAGRWRKITPAHNGIDYPVGARDPRLLEWTSGDGVTHYFDFTTIPCLGGQPCPANASVARSAARELRPPA